MFLPENVINNIFSFMSSPTANLIKYAVDDAVIYYMHNLKYGDSFEEGMDDAYHFKDISIWIYSNRKNINLIKNVLSYLSGYLVILEEGCERDFSNVMNDEERKVWIESETEVVRNLIENILFLKN